MFQYWQLPWREKLLICTVESYLSHWDSDEAEAHEDGTENTDEERPVVTPADTLIQPFAVVVKHMDTFIAHWTVFSPRGGDGYIAKVAPPIFYHMVVFAFVKLWYRLFGIESKEVWIWWIKEEGGEVGDVVESKYKGIDDYKR